MDGARRFVWQLIATFGYCVVFFLVAAIGQLTLAESLIPAAVLAMYALSAQGFLAPWRYWLATGPWLLILAWVVYVSDGGLDCGSDCDGSSVGNFLFLVAGIAFVGVIVVGPLLAVQRWRNRRS